MTKKDYVKIAQILKDARRADLFSSTCVDSMIVHFSRMLQADNPRFNPDRFRDACK